MKEYQEELAAKLEAFLSSANAKVSELGALRAQLFPYDTLDAAASAFGQDLADSNKLNSEALMSVRNEVSSLISTLDAIVAWITLSVPKIEDGGNFGVSIQFEIRKAIADVRKDLKDKFDALADYHEKRAALVPKAVNKVKIERKETESSSNSTGGEKGEESKTSKSSSTDTSQTLSDVLPDNVDALIDFDVKWYFNFLCIMNDVVNGHAGVSSLVRLNKEKLEKPRGSTNYYGMG